MTKQTPQPPARFSPEARDQRPEKIRGMFGAITPAYDRLNRLLSGWLDTRWRAAAAREICRDPAPTRRFLDVATGTGDLAEALRCAAMKAGAQNIEIVGADFTRPMLERALAKFPIPGAPGLRRAWIEADALNLPVASGAFDASAVAFGLRNMIDKSRALAEMTRAVRPGGRVAVLEFSQPRNPFFRALYDLYSFKVMPRLGAWISGCDAYLYLAESIRAFWTPAELAEAMRKTGLADVKIHSFMFGAVCLHIGTKPKED